MLLRFLKLKLIVNGMHIHMLMKNRPVVIMLPTNPSRIVVTDGFHITKSIQVSYQQQQTKHYSINCAIDNDVLAGGLIVMLILFAMGITSGLLILLLLSTLPIVYVLYFYYIKRQDFIQVLPVYQRAPNH